MLLGFIIAYVAYQVCSWQDKTFDEASVRIRRSAYTSKYLKAGRVFRD